MQNNNYLETINRMQKAHEYFDKNYDAMIMALIAEELYSGVSEPRNLTEEELEGVRECYDKYLEQDGGLFDEVIFGW